MSAAVFGIAVLAAGLVLSVVARVAMLRSLEERYVGRHRI